MTIEEINEITPQSISILDACAVDALAELAERFGLKSSIVKGRYTSSSYTVTFKFECIADDGVPAEFVSLARHFGLTAEHYGRVFMAGGKDFKLTGFNLRRRKYPVTGMCVKSGDEYKFTKNVLKEMK